MFSLDLRNWMKSFTCNCNDFEMKLTVKSDISGHIEANGQTQCKF